MSQPFIRRAELRIQQKITSTSTDQSGKIVESSTTKNLLNIVADGSRENLQISFVINKQLVGQPNESTIEIYNLRPDTRKLLMQPKQSLRAQLFVGWSNIPMSLLADGQVLQVMPSKEGSSNKTTMTLFDGYNGISAGLLQKVYPANTEVKTVVFDLASAMPDVQTSGSKIDIEGIFGSRGYIVNGRVAVELDRLANCYGFSWSVQNGVFQAIKDTRAGNTKHKVSNEAGNLFHATPQLQDKMQLQTGIEITAFMNPKVTPGDIVQLESGFVPMYNGDYKVHTIEFNGDTSGDAWQMRIESKKFGV